MTVIGGPVTVTDKYNSLAILPTPAADTWQGPSGAVVQPSLAMGFALTLFLCLMTQLLPSSFAFVPIASLTPWVST